MLKNTEIQSQTKGKKFIKNSISNLFIYITLYLCMFLPYIPDVVRLSIYVRVKHNISHLLALMEAFAYVNN